MERQKIRFASGDTQCTAWHYPGVNGGCVIMTGGFAVTKEPGTDLFARRFNEAAGRSTRTAGTRTGGRRSPPVRPFAWCSTGRAGTPPGYGARC